MGDNKWLQYERRKREIPTGLTAEEYEAAKRFARSATTQNTEEP